MYIVTLHRWRKTCTRSHRPVPVSAARSESDQAIKNISFPQPSHDYAEKIYIGQKFFFINPPFPGYVMCHSQILSNFHFGFWSSPSSLFFYQSKPLYYSPLLGWWWRASSATTSPQRPPWWPTATSSEKLKENNQISFYSSVYFLYWNT